MKEKSIIGAQSSRLDAMDVVVGWTAGNKNVAPKHQEETNTDPKTEHLE
jgi:hypothetical protein